MRVAFNLEQLLASAPGGIGRYTAELARLVPQVELDRAERVELVPFVARHSRSAIDAALREHGLAGVAPEVQPISLPRPLLYDAWHTLGAARLVRLPARLRAVDVVHAPSVAVPPSGPYRLVVTVHDAAPLRFPETYPRRGRWFHTLGVAAAARRADLVITVSHAAAAELAEHTAISPQRVRVVPNGVDHVQASDHDVRAARTVLGIGADPYVLWAGSLEPRKNVGVLVDGFARFAATAPGSRHQLVLVGPEGWMEDRATVLAPARARGVAARVRTAGRLRADVLRALYRGADLVAVPSIHEGFGLPALEAMAQGTGVLASDIPSLREVTGGAAELVAPREPEAWAAALERLLAGDPARRAELAGRGARHADGFSWERCARETIAVYREALDRPRR